MDAGVKGIDEILSDHQYYVVPFYQRRYQWKENRIIPLWEDIASKAREAMTGQTVTKHYLGALIFAKNKDALPVDNIISHRVIDGQQRLTSLLLLLVAIREVARASGLGNIVKKIDKHLVNHSNSKKLSENAKYKLVPTPADQDLFRDLMKMSFHEIQTKYVKNIIPNNQFFEKQLAFENYKILIKRILKFVEITEYLIEDQILIETSEISTKKQNVLNKLESIIVSIYERMCVAVIYLEDNDNAQLIYETLNSRVEPLNTMDLVRNDIFLRAEKGDATVDDLYTEYWRSFDENWWYQELRFSHSKRPRIDHFLSYTMTAVTGKRINLSDLFTEYQNFSKINESSNFQSIEDELQFLNKYSPIFECMERQNCGDESLIWIAKKLANWKITTPYPVVMQIMTNVSDASERDKLFELIYSYIVRRALCDLPGRNYINIFHKLAEYFFKNSPSVENFISFFNERSHVFARFPSDDEFRVGIENNPAFKILRDTRIRDVLVELEMYWRGQVTESIPLDKISVEHVLPTKWTSEWPFWRSEWVGPDSECEKATKRKSYINKLGNLTLVTEKLNNSVGRQGFLKKKEMYEKHSITKMNKWFNDKNKWDENDIDKRGRYISKISTDIWIGLPD